MHKLSNVSLSLYELAFYGPVNTVKVMLSQSVILFRASVKRTYDVYYSLRLPPDVQTELQRHTADFRNFFCPSEIDTRDVQKLSKSPPTSNELYDVCPAYLPEIRYLFNTVSLKDVPLSACGSFIDSRVKRRGALLMAA